MFADNNQIKLPFSCRGDTVRFTLWNENARAFDRDAYEKEAKPTVMAVSSCWVKTYGGNKIITCTHS